MLDRASRTLRALTASSRCSSMSPACNKTDRNSLPHPTRRNWLWFSIQVLVRTIFTVWFRYRALGAEKVPADGGALFLINHQSFLDPLLVGLPLSRPVSYLARDSLFRVPLVGWMLRSTYVMSINREAAGTSSIKEAVQRMQHGFLVGIFPEGTRTADGSIGPLKPGFVALIRRVKLPVYPIGIAGAHDAFPRDTWLMRPRRICVVFGDPLTPEDVERFSQRGREKEMVALVREQILRCQQEAEAWRCGAVGSRP